MAFALAACEVEQTEEGDAPDAEGGEAPEYAVDAPDVDVGMEEKTVTVPDVDVDMEEKTMTVPDVDVRMEERRMNVPDVDINPADEEAENPGEAEEPPPDGR
ncbi:MAG: hypothetical protein ACREH3_12795 [Geminicoccales bacterium]